MSERKGEDEALARSRRVNFYARVVIVLLLVALLAAYVVDSLARTPVSLTPGATIGAVRFPPGDTPNGGRGAIIDGMACRQKAGAVVRAHLALFVAGKQIAIPAGIGVAPPFRLVGGQVVGGRCRYPLSTKDASGTVLVRAGSGQFYTLGEFFDIWGRPLTRQRVASFVGPVTTFVGGTRYPGSPLGVLLLRHTLVTLEVGSPIVPPPRYRFPPGS